MHRRPFRVVLLAVFDSRHWFALLRSFLVYRHPIENLWKYLTRPKNGYPAVVELKTPIGRAFVDTYVPDDRLTINEIFCRNDYPADSDTRVCVDFGSNIGVSALYFLTRNPHAIVYLFEPNPRNISKLIGNLRFFEGRYRLSECGVATEDGELVFGFEPTGRYGGAGLDYPEKITRSVVSAERVLRDVLAEHGSVDVLKIDIEALEMEIIESLPLDVLSKISRIYVECEFTENPLSETHDLRQRGSIGQFFARDTSSRH